MRGVGLWALVVSLGLLAWAQEFTGDYSTHDPSLIRAGNTFYVFSTGDPNRGAGGIQIRASQDGKNWKYLGTVFAELPAWIVKEVGFVPNLWAPDISFWNGQYHLYYAASTFGSQDSAIGLATNVTLDPKSPRYKWVDEGMVVRSGTANTFNAIDPNFVRDAQGQPWLVWGSFWDGIRLGRLDPRTGKLLASDPRLYRLASRGGGAIEAPGIVYRGGYYYLFVSFDACCKGLESTYNIRVGRSRAITGPYVDQNGVPMTEGGGTLLLASQGRYVGPGGQFVYNDGGTFRLVFHYYDRDDSGLPKLAMRGLEWVGGWPKVGGQ
jgi:arabinan endo-1,5-alpha-L-arabinosidase